MPTVKEINKIEKDFENTDIKFCGSCLKEDDKTILLMLLHGYNMTDVQYGQISVAHKHK